MTNPKIVVLCMENRSFDEYFGTFPGAIGFKDPRGANIFPQPHTTGNGKKEEIRPYRASTFSNYTRTDPNHSWSGAQTAWNSGEMNGWSSAQVDSFFTSMSYFASNDIPFHWQLAQEFLLCDTYFCSVLGPTWPNRLYLMSGTIFSQSPPPTPGSVVLFDPKTDLPGLFSQNGMHFPWQSYGSMIEPGIWTLYDDQSWVPPWMSWQGLRPPPYAAKNWQPWDLNMFSCLADQNGSPGTIGTSAGPTANYSATEKNAEQSSFEIAAAAGTLPSISWLIPPFACTEHPQYFSWDGECYLSGVVNAVINSPDWADPGIVLIVTYDENGGFFDHVNPPTSVEFASDDEPWVKEANGASSISGPVGGGFRIPTIIVSPWTVGAGLSSNIKPNCIFDHTSIIQYLEKITGISCSNLPQDGWRRNTFSSLTELIDMDRAPVPASQVTLATPEVVAAWRTDALTRVYGGTTSNTPILPQPWPFPAQSWPPLEQMCYFLPGNTIFSAKDLSSTEGATTLSGVFSFVVDGFVPGELNLGAKYVPEGYAPLFPEIELTVFPSEYCVEGTEFVGSYSFKVVINAATSSQISNLAVPQTFNFSCDLVTSNPPPPFPVWIQLKGHFTSRLTWIAPRTVMRLVLN